MSNVSISTIELMQLIRGLNRDLLDAGRIVSTTPEQETEIKACAASIKQLIEKATALLDSQIKSA